MTGRDENEKCAFCDRIWGVFGVGLGGLLMLIGLDLLSGGTISKMVGKPRIDGEEYLTIEDEEDYASEEIDND